MKRFDDIDEARRGLLELLESWHEGTKDGWAVLEAAESLEGSWYLWRSDADFDAAAIDSDHSDARSIVSALINMLSVLHHDGWTRQDAPAMRAFLLASDTDPELGWVHWAAYEASVDWEQRKRDLARDLLYRPFVTWGRGPWNADK